MNETNENIKKGGISVETEHIFPIIKKWLYSEKDIFLREIISNATDAITKLRRLQSLGQIEATDEKYEIRVVLNKNEKTLTVSDNGIGMTEEELSKYLCQIALSGALDFIAKYEGEEDSSKSGIIGHFGLGFYSSFMVSETVDVITKSYNGSPASRWVCHESGEYEMYPSNKAERGTEVVMHIAEDEDEYLEENKIRSMLDKYCAFMPYEIYLDVINDEEKDENKDEEIKPINDTTPLWQKNSADCTKEEYNEFYRKVFADYREPLFSIHINADYPLNFKGILYFPQIANEFENVEGQVKLYYNQVFVADNIKEVIPEYFIMLKGVLDCPELPLNVSRSYLQNNAYISKVSSHIVKKVADKLNSLCNNEREQYNKDWDKMKTFVEYACMRDRKFYDRVHDSILLKITDKSYLTLSEYLEGAKEKHENIIYYATDAALQSQYVSMFNAEGIKVALLDRIVDTQFATMAEQYMSADNVKFVRIDADVAAALKGDGSTTENKDISELFKKVSGNSELKVKFEALKDAKIPALLNVTEESRRMEEMMRLYSMGDNNKDIPAFALDTTLIVNTNAALVTKLADLVSNDSQRAGVIAKHIYKLSLIGLRKLSAEEMQGFLSDGFDILNML